MVSAGGRLGSDVEQRGDEGRLDLHVVPSILRLFFSNAITS
jgi:hypothetical protein